ncbi:hypothetical protein [Cytobacillus oceanisediminis]|uniref:hypothetical protein n=1 Tax=Cytobacillus oceanisediminis TaxID=665099 RepID=UPI001FB556C2|nr:hypothetical protein [Cytobacillus oceanisediminis]UOE58155.1 hypothetical protein IRB79_26990 [Cytobacillus oceanisediminis]
MIGNFSVESVKAALVYEAYTKAHDEISQYKDDKVPVREIDWFDYEDEARHMIGSNYYRYEILEQLCALIQMEKPDEEYRQVIENIDENMREVGFSIEIAGLFYFRTLFENLHWFTSNERLVWLTKMEELFSSFNLEHCQCYLGFYESNFKTQFFDGGHPFFSRFSEHMKYTYVFTYDNFDSFEDMGPEFIGRFVKFALSFLEFNKELMLELNEKRQVKIGA